MHCKAVLNRMEITYAGSTIRQAYITMGTLFKSAVMNDIIAKHPMNGVRYTKPVRAVNDIKYLTVDEQEKFMEVAKRSHNYRQYALLLETGLRTAELIGLTWDSIDWKKRTLTVNKSLEYRHKQGYWRAGPPKTKKVIEPFLLLKRHIPFLKAAMMKEVAGKKPKRCHRFWNIQTAEREKRNVLSCEIWFLLTGEQGNPQKTVLMTHICISCVMKPGLNAFVCTCYVIVMRPARLSEVCSRKSCSNY